MLVLNRWCTSASADSTRLVGEVEEQRRDLARRQHALVDQRARRQADHVERLLRLGRQPERVHLVLDPLADHVELPLERRRRPPPTAARPTNSCLKTGSAATARGPSWLSSVGTSRQPSTCCPSSATIRSIVASTCRRAASSRSAGTPARRRTSAPAAAPCSSRVGLLAEEPVRHLNQDAGAVAGVGFAAAGAAVLEVDEHLQGVPDDGVRTAALRVHDEADAAGVVLVPRVVEAVGGRWLRRSAHAFMRHCEPEEKRILRIVSMRSACGAGMRTAHGRHPAGAQHGTADLDSGRLDRATVETFMASSLTLRCRCAASSTCCCSCTVPATGR